MLLIDFCTVFNSLINYFSTFICDIWNVIHFLWIFMLFLIVIAGLDIIGNLDKKDIKPAWKPKFFLYEKYYGAFKEIVTSVFIVLPLTFPYYKNSISGLSDVINSYTLFISAVVIYSVCAFGTEINFQGFLMDAKSYIRRLLIVFCWSVIITSLLCICMKDVLSNFSEIIICCIFILLSLLGLCKLYKSWNYILHKFIEFL